MTAKPTLDHKPIRRSAETILKERAAARKQFLDFISWIQDHPSERWVFRGQSQYWSLRSSVGRIASYKPDFEQLLLREFKRSGVGFLSDWRSNSNWDWLAIAQHHGLPTRLIDWTTNPLVACYFASEASPRGKKDGEIVAVEARQIGFYNPDDREEEDPFEISEARFLRPSRIAARITSQRGLFSIHPSPEKAWNLKNKTERFTIPANMKADFRKAMFAMGVDAASLMADLDGLAETLRWRVENRMLSE